MIRDFLIRESAQLGREFTPIVEATPRGSTLYLAMAGTGVAVLPRPLAELAHPHGAMIASLRPTRWRSVYLLRRAAPLSPAARAMRAVLTTGNTS